MTNKNLDSIAFRVASRLLKREAKGQEENPLNLIWKKLEPIKYGSYDTKTKKFVTDINGKNYKNIKILTPKETLKYEYGTCYEQAILTAYLAKKNNLPYSCGFFRNKVGDTHLICCIKYQNQWFWVEHAWGEQQKIHGSFTNLKNIDQTVSKLFEDSYKSPIEYKKFDFEVKKFFTGLHLNPEITNI